MISLIFSSVLVATPVTFNEDVKPILEKRCSECHPGIVKQDVAERIKEKIYQKAVLGVEMPPNFRIKLNKRERQVISDWVKGVDSE